MQNLYLALEKTLNTFKHSYQKPKPLAEAILKASRFFIERSGVSPWSDPQFCAAYVAHFLPMNVFRIQQGLLRLQAQSTFTERKITEDPSIATVTPLQLLQNTPIYDYGCGPLTFLIAYRMTFRTWPQRYQFFDLDPKAPRLGEQILKSMFQNPPPLQMLPLQQVPANYLLSLSYSLNEVPEHMKSEFLKFTSLLIFEPSMRNTSRQLLEFRAQALNQGFLSLAPCTHNGPCPMLTHSQKDWCFDRAQIEIPEMAQALYEALPFDQEQATFSYLLLSKNTDLDLPSKTSSFLRARVVGDVLKEKGKTRTMICRGQDREFVAVLKKQKLDLKLRRGDHIILPPNIEVKGNELRITTLPET